MCVSQQQQQKGLLAGAKLEGEVEGEMYVLKGTRARALEDLQGM